MEGETMMTDEERKGLLRAIRRRNEDLRKFKYERGFYKRQAESNERWAEQLNMSFKDKEEREKVFKTTVENIENANKEGWTHTVKVMFSKGLQYIS